ncbi:dolichyl-phosphate-mannose-protein mannosyltransferase [Enteropsectra breve]|nr:dolichyl-phosphate-mannose-protein mannosyltransferase [Enteropsectra breve]
MHFFAYSPHIFIFLLSFLVKEHAIHRGSHPIWDEAHFGKFSQSYLERVFYFDVHPPLGKLLIAFSGKLFNQPHNKPDQTEPENFKFDGGTDFPESFDYVGMRKFSALVSSFLPLFSFLILKDLGFSLTRAFLGSSLFIFDNGFTSISRLILLDPYLLTFTSLVIYLLVKLYLCARISNIQTDNNIHNVNNRHNIHTNDNRHNTNNSHNINDIHTADNKRILLALGAALGCIISVKWIGCLTMLMTGLYVIFDLYSTLCRNPRSFLLSFMKYALFLILLPIAIYTALFGIHFSIACKSGPDDGHMSTAFQQSLDNSIYQNTLKYISYGKQITIRNERGYLHSHSLLYPAHLVSYNTNKVSVHKDSSIDYSSIDYNSIEDSSIDHEVNQITYYGAKDSNNNWYLQRVSQADSASEGSFLKDGDRVVVLHAETKKYLSVLGTGAVYADGLLVGGKQEINERGIFQVMKINKETKILKRIFRFVMNNIDDIDNINDIDDVDDVNEIAAISSKFILYNKASGTFLASTENILPSWASAQGEIFASSERKNADLFAVEENFYTDDPETNVKANDNKNSGWKGRLCAFMEKLIEHNIAMWKTNKSFVQDGDLEPHRIVSEPWEWPVLRRGLRMSSWDKHHKFYLFMNPVVLYGSSLCVVLCMAMYFMEKIRKIREIKKNKQNDEICCIKEINNELKNIKESTNHMNISQRDNNSQRNMNQVALVEKKPADSKRRFTDYSHCKGMNANNNESIRDKNVLNSIMQSSHNIRTSNINNNKPGSVNRDFMLFIILAGYAIHYFSFFAVGRVLYIHHYFVPYFFAILSISFVFSYCKIKYLMAFTAMSIISYLLFSPLSYGFNSDESVKYLTVFKEWDFV